jgi:hypothetical protein
VGGTLGSLHVVLRAPGAAFRVFLVEGDAIGFAHESELDVDVIEEPGRQEAGVGCACRDSGELGPVLGDEGGVVDAKGRIEQRAGVDEVHEALLFGAHRPGIFFEPFEKAKGFVFVVEFVCDRGDRGTTKKIYGFLEAGFEGTFHVIGKSNAFFTSGHLSERAEPFA